MTANHIFVDTNVLIGFFINLKNDKSALNYLFELHGKRLFTSTLAVAQLVSVFQKKKTNAEIKKIIKSIQAKFEILSFVDSDITKAVAIEASDIEDNIQYVISSKKKCFYFVTNNTKDYTYFADIKVLDPKQIRAIPR